MIKHSKKLLTQLGRKARNIKNQTDQVIPSFLGTLVDDIKRNWVDVKSFTKAHVSRIKFGSVREDKLTRKSNASQLINPI